MSSADILKSTALSRRLPAEFAEMNRLLSPTSLTDDLTNRIRTWHKNFFRSFNQSGKTAVVLQAYTNSLQELLVDSISQTPLDEEALLGSDGITYGYKALAVHLSSIQESYRHRSPLNPQNEARFTAAPHPVVPHMVRWLRSHGVELRASLEIERSYNDLSSRHVLAMIPSERSEKIERIRRQQQERNAAANAEISGFRAELQNVEAQARAAIDHAFQPLAARVDAHAARVMNNIDAMENSDRERLNALQSVVESLQRDVGDLQRENERLEGQLRENSEALSAAARETMELQVAINETRIAIAEKKANDSKMLMTAIAVVGICCCATLAFSACLSAAGAGATSASIAPSNGAIMASVSFAI